LTLAAAPPLKSQAFELASLWISHHRAFLGERLMKNPIERRALLAMAGVAGAALPTLAQAQTPSSTAAKDVSMGKKVLAIPKDNAVFGASQASFEKYGYAPAVKAGGLLFIAGVVGVKPDGTVPDSIAEQGELALQRTAEILRLEGLGMADLVEVVSYHVDLASNLADFLPVKERYFERPFPAWSIIGVQALARPVLKIEIRSIAALRS
jgi:enamine deaminase RidA (YjgF/YER057c/UK114 family)